MIIEKKRKKPNISGWSVTNITQKQVKKLSVKFRLKKVRTIHKIFDILFGELDKSEDFKKFAYAYSCIQEKELAAETSIYVSYDIDKEYMKRFKETMYRYDFTDRSPFFRVVIDYVYNHYALPVIKNLPEIRKKIESQGFRVEVIQPILRGSILIQIENPEKSREEQTNG